MLDWIQKNIDWIFSGIGVAILIPIVSFVIRSFKRKSKERAEYVEYSNSSIKTNGSINDSNIIIGSNNQLLQFKSEEKNLDEQEKELLMTAAKDGEFLVLKNEQLGSWIRVGCKNFVNEGDPGVSATYLEALRSLSKRKYVEQRRDDLFVLTGTGFLVARKFTSE